MSSVALANTSNAIAVYGQSEALKEKINEWFKNPITYGDQAQSSFVKSINSYAMKAFNSIESHVKLSKKERLNAIVTKRNRDVSSLNFKPSLIAKSLGCGTFGSLASMQLATQITVAMTLASYSTPAGWIGGTGTAVVYYQLDKRVQTGKIKDKALLDMEKTEGVAEKILSSLKQCRLQLELDGETTENSRLSRINDNVNAENADLTAQNNNLKALVTTVQNSLAIATNQITTLDGAQTTANGQLAAAQTRISTLDGDVTALRQQNQILRTDLASTAARINELQRQNAQNLNAVRTQSADDLASVYRNHHALIDRMFVTFETRQREIALKQEEREGRTVVKQLVERGIEKALRYEQEDKISKQEDKISNLSIHLAQKSAAFEILQMEHDQMSERIGQKFDVMTQAMARKPIESSVSELLRSNDQRGLSDLDSENNSDFIEVAQEM